MFKKENIIIGCVVLTLVLVMIGYIPSKSDRAVIGSQTATAGVCSGSEPVNTLCNENINNLTVSTAFDSSGVTTLTGDLLAYKLIEGGNVGTITQSGAISTSTASQLCDDSLINLTITNATGTNTTYLPTAATLTADCLTVNGQHKEVVLRNTGSATSTTLVANTGTVLNKSGDTGGTVAMAATSTAIIDFVRLSSTAVEANISYYIAN